MTALALTTTQDQAQPLSTADIDAAIETALGRIPPLWPLKHFVAVNPFLGFASVPFRQACLTLAAVSGQAPVQQASDYLAAWNRKQITRRHLDAVATRAWTADRLLDWVIQASSAQRPATRAIFTVADRMDHGQAHAHWGELITGEISKFCAVIFDENQTIWTSPWKGTGIYAGWLQYARINRNPEAFGLRDFRAFVAGLPSDARSCIHHCLRALPVRDGSLTDFLHRQLFTVLGWAGYIQYRVREDRMRGKSNDSLLDLLAIRLAYDTALHRANPGFDDEPPLVSGEESASAEDIQAACLWQRAYEWGLQEELGQRLTRGQDASATTVRSRPSFQAIFCIDVRSEVFRRHLEAAAPSAQTIGFAGFFGIPVAHRPAGEERPATRCPVLLVPPVATVDAASPEEAATVIIHREFKRAWKGFQNSAISCFSFVETLGLGYAGKLGLKAAAACGCGSPHLPALDPATPDPVATRTALAAGALKNMGLTTGFARLVLICGHGSQSANNPYASALDCGACGGHAGDVNARLAADILNDPQVRQALAKQQIQIPDDTWFLAGLHNTMTDDVELYDLHAVPASHHRDLEELRQALATAGHNSRKERAHSLGLAGVRQDALHDAVTQRTVDISQVRPEWGLANNAAFIAAPRRRTAGLKLDGRVFLHDYDAAKDPDHSVLTLILTAPVVVASWINLQYYGSRVNPQIYGSGNKTLHNVAGGIGVFEGNGGDLRPGLPLQSIHNGEDYVHEPRRLSVYVEAEPRVIGAILEANPSVRDLFANGWIHLFALQGSECLRFREDGAWVPLEPTSTPV
jgi:uncharacterized protein YbcC (UPF0753/DUF2309 family)